MTRVTAHRHSAAAAVSATSFCRVRRPRSRSFQALSAFLKNERNFPKVNFGAIGNLVPQLHLHIVGRTPEDACWPRPVWGNLPEGPAYTKPEIETLRNQLIEHCDLQPVD